MDTNDCNTLFQEDEEVLDDPIKLLDLEAYTVFCGSENYLRNVTIEHPGCVVNTSLEDYELKVKESLLQEIKKPMKDYLYAIDNDNLLSKCRSCSIKVIDCYKYPRYYQNYFGSRNQIQVSNKEQNVMEIEEEKDEVIIVECNELYKNRGQDVNKDRVGKLKADRNQITSIVNAFDGKVTKQIDVFSNVQKGGAEQAPDLVITSYTRIIDKAIEKIQINMESCQNSKNLNHNIGNKLLLGSNSAKIYSENMPQNQKVSKDVSNHCKRDHNKKKNVKQSNKRNKIYTSEQISKTKLRIKIDSLKSKAIISNINYYKDENKGFNENANLTNKKQYEKLKMFETKDNSFTNKEQNYENKHKRFESNCPLLSCSVPSKIHIETKNGTSHPNRNISPNKNDRYSRQLFSADKIIPPFHEYFLNHSYVLSQTEPRTKHSNITNYNYEPKRLKASFDSIVTFNMVSNTPQCNHEYCILNKNSMASINELDNKNNNTEITISNFSANCLINPMQVKSKLPISDEIISQRSGHANPVIIENMNNMFFMRSSTEIAAQLEKERPRYLLPSNCNLPDGHISNIPHYGSNLNIPRNI